MTPEILIFVNDIPLYLEIDAVVGDIYEQYERVSMCQRRFSVIYYGGRPLIKQKDMLADIGLCPETRLEARIAPYIFLYITTQDVGIINPLIQNITISFSDVYIDITETDEIYQPGRNAPKKVSTEWNITHRCSPDAISDTFTIEDQWLLTTGEKKRVHIDQALASTVYGFNRAIIMKLKKDSPRHIISQEYAYRILTFDTDTMKALILTNRRNLLYNIRLPDAESTDTCYYNRRGVATFVSRG